MKKCNNNLGISVIIAAITAIVVVVLITGVQEKPTDREGWTTYTSEKGFSFQHPENVKASERDIENSDETWVTIVAENAEVGGDVPYAVIQVSPIRVSFALWEGLQWLDFPGVIESFEFTK